MNRRGFVALVATGAVASIAGCNGESGEPTPPSNTPTPTHTPKPTTNAPTEPPRTDTPTESPPPTTTGTPAFAVGIESLQPADREVYDGVATVTARVENTGTASGQHTATVTVSHRQLDRTYTESVTVALEPGESQRVRLRADFRTTGVYDVLVNGERVTALDVERLSERDGRSAGRRATTVQGGDPDIDVIATGEVVAK